MRRAARRLDDDTSRMAAIVFALAGCLLLVVGPLEYALRGADASPVRAVAWMVAGGAIMVTQACVLLRARVASVRRPAAPAPLSMSSSASV